MIKTLESMEKRYQEIDHLMAQPEVVVDRGRLQSLAQERSSIEPTITKYREYKMVSKNLDETRELLKDSMEQDMVVLAKQEIESLKSQQATLLQELQQALLPKDPHDEKDVIVEIRGGTGGREAAMFAADLFRMYTHYAQAKGWQVEIIDKNESGIGGFKEIIFEVKGKGAFSHLKYERGVHRVQRVPVTEASGRIHTSTATVAVLPEAEEIELKINPADLKMDFYHSRGAGGQNVNKVETAVRITHLPTGLIATCQDERSQLRNRNKAMAVLRARLLDQQQSQQKEQVTQDRRSQVGSGERSEKIRTYNFPQDRVTDHRIGLTIHNLPRVLEGNLDDLINALAVNEQTQNLEVLPV